VACGDPVTAPTREITLDFCGTWAAYQNDGGSWTSLPSAQGQVTFAATDRLAIATVSRVGPSLNPLLEVHYLTAEQAEATFTCGAATSEPASTKQLRGSVAGLSTGATAAISMGRGVTSANASFPTFQVRAPRDGPADLIATHRPPFEPTPPSGRADKVIVRRGEDHADGATMPVLDFASSAGFAPQPNTLTIGGVPAGTTVSVQTQVTTARGATAFLKYEFDQSTSVVTTHSLPATNVAEGDLHQTSVDTRDRSVLFFYRDPADRTVALGPVASTPVFTTPVGSSGQALRVDVTAQSVYGSQVSVVLTPPQPSTSGNMVVIRATKEYFGGTPAIWSLTLPDFTGVPGFSPLWGLAPGPNAWTLTVTGLPYRFSSESARDGEVYRSATAFGIIINESGDVVALRR
ncbi:MAG: hypothetical protein ABR499_17900, partial [Gemmatimonadaceae bacterium]